MSNNMPPDPARLTKVELVATGASAISAAGAVARRLGKPAAAAEAVALHSTISGSPGFELQSQASCRT